MKDKIQVQQNNALRAVLNVDFRFPTCRLNSELGIDTTRVDMKKACCKIVFKGFYDLGLSALNDMFTLYVPLRELRSSDSLQITVPKVNTKFGAKNVTLRRCLYWNMQPLSIKSCKRTNAFKT